MPRMIMRKANQRIQRNSFEIKWKHFNKIEIRKYVNGYKLENYPKIVPYSKQVKP